MVTASLVSKPLPDEANAYVVQLFEQHGIPNVLWGDYVTSLYNIPQVVLTCGFIVPKEYFDRACSVLATSHLSRCHCKSMEHGISSNHGYSLPTHYTVPGCPYNLMFACSAEELFDIIPIVREQPNPLGIKLVDHTTVRSVDGSEARARVLTLPSLAKVVIALIAIHAAHPKYRSGLAYPYYVLLRYTISTGLKEEEIEEGPIRDIYSKGPLPTETIEEPVSMIVSSIGVQD